MSTALPGLGGWEHKNLDGVAYQNEARKEWEEDPFTNNVCADTAAEFSKLAGLRGITNTIEWKDGAYYANGENCGPSVHGLYEWLNRQPGVKP